MRIDELLAGWRDGSMTDQALRELIALLALPENRDRLLDDWLIEGALADVLRVAALAQVAPEVAWPERLAQALRTWLPLPVPLWSRCSLAALPVAAVLTLGVFVLLPTSSQDIPTPRDPAIIAQRLLETQPPDSP